MAFTTAKDIVDYYDDLLFTRIHHEETWELIGQLLVPHESEIQSRSFPGTRQTQHLYDSTGADALDKLTSAIMGTMFSPVVPWFFLTPRQPELKQDSDTLDWLEIVSDDLFQTINASSFDRVAPGMVQNKAAFGTGALGVVELTPRQARGASGFRGLHHLAVPIGTYVIDEDARGNVDTLIRTYWVSARAALREWPNAEWSTDQKKKLAENPHYRVQVIHSTIPNDQPSGLQWDSKYIMTGMNDAMILNRAGSDRVMLEESGFREFPYIVPRWFQSPGETWGRGRGHLAFPELRTSNRARQLKLRAWGKSIDPPLKVLNRGVFGKVRLVPGAENVVRSMDAIEAMDFKIRFDHQAIPESESKMQIRQMFFTEQLLQFAVDRKTPPTATEILQRMDFLHQLLGPAAQRLRIEGQTPYIKRLFNIKMRAGAYPPPPDALLQAGGIIDIEYLGPLARAQHNDELRGLSDTMAIVGGFAQADPDVFDNYDLDTMARDVPRITGVPRRYLRPTPQVLARRRQRAAQQRDLLEQQQRLAQAQTAERFAAAEEQDAQATSALQGAA